MKGNPSCSWCHGSGYQPGRDGDVNPCFDEDRRLPEFAAMRDLIDKRLADVRSKYDALDRERQRTIEKLEAENRRLRSALHTAARTIERDRFGRHDGAAQ